MACNVQSTPEQYHKRAKRPPNWDKILWAPKIKVSMKPRIFRDDYNDNKEVSPPKPTNSMNKSSPQTTPTFSRKPIYKPVVLKFDDDDD